MAIKKSEIYSSLWASCDELRGGMDASLYKDYILTLLFIKYVSDKYADSDDMEPAFVIPKGGGFQGMVNLKGKDGIGDSINKEIIQKLIDANPRLSHSDFPDFNDATKLGEGKEMKDRLTNLIAIFERPSLDFSKNRAEDDDLLGDAYEYLMRNFATESGKSKGQFYTPAEVSRVMAKVVGIKPNAVTAGTTAYDPTCGSGSLLLKVAAEAPTGIKMTLEGQEKDVATAGLARMNMILHGFTSANIQSGSTLASPKFLEGERLRTYDFVVANPPFSDKKWATGFNPANDTWGRFTWGTPPAKQGDFAYLLHIIRSMKSQTGKGACILPHGVLFRGTEATIRKELVNSGILKGIIGLPPNLFYGTGIPACILVLDKENSQARRGVFIIDASRGFEKSGNKNRLRERDIHRIVDTFSRGIDVPKYARMVPLDEITGEKNDYNLNIPRYIDSSDAEDIHNIEAHILGGIPANDIEGLAPYWTVMPALRASLFAAGDRPQAFNLNVGIPEIKQTIMDHADFQKLSSVVGNAFATWKASMRPQLASTNTATQPKVFIAALGDSILEGFADVPLVDAYAMYQHLMDLWADVMQDDCYYLAAEGWKAEPVVAKAKDRKGNEKILGWSCDLIPKGYVVSRYFGKEQSGLDALQAQIDGTDAQIASMLDEYGEEDGLLDKVRSKSDVELKCLEVSASAYIAENPGSSSAVETLLGQIEDKNAQKELRKELKTYMAGLQERLANEESSLGLSEEEQDAQIVFSLLALHETLATQKSEYKKLDAELDEKALAKYADLSEEEIRSLVIDDKWYGMLASDMAAEIDQISQTLTSRVRQLAERYEKPMPQLEADVAALSEKVAGHLKQMGVVWK